MTDQAKPSLSGIVEVIGWAELSPETQRTIREVGPFLLDGKSQTAIASALDVKDDTIAKRVAAARAELIEHALAKADELGAGLRARIEALAADVATPRAAEKAKRQRPESKPRVQDEGRGQRRRRESTRSGGGLPRRDHPNE